MYDAANNLVSRTDFSYDIYGTGGLTGVTGASQHDDLNYGTGFTTRGNLTSTTKYPSLPSLTPTIARSFTYDTLGNVLTAQVDCCNLEQRTLTSTTQYAYPETIKRGPTGTQLTTSRTYDFNTGLLTLDTDPNSQQTTYGYDTMKRLTSVARPLGAGTTISFDDVAALPKVTTTSKLDSSNSLVQIQTTDGVGKKTKQETQSATGTSYSIVETQYDVLGRVTQVSNPHGPSEAAVWTTSNYNDPLGRLTTVTPPGNAGSYQYSYSGNQVTTTDPASKQRRSYTDAMGRLTRVDEPGYSDGAPGTGSVSVNGGPVLCIQLDEFGRCALWDSGTVWVTVDTFTASVAYTRSSTPTSIAAALISAFNGNAASPVTAGGTGATIMLTARQSGALTNYSLSGGSTSDQGGGGPFYFGLPNPPTLTGGVDGTGANGSTPSISTPLATVYTYDPLNNLTFVMQGVQQRTSVYDSMGRLKTATIPEAGAVSYTYTDFSKVLTRTDARGVITTYGYDGLNRVKTVSYNVGTAGVPATPTVTLNYDEGGAAAFALGRLTSMTDGLGSETYTYDALGRVTRLTKTIGTTSYPISYQYNLADKLTSITYPSGRQVAQTFDPIGRISTIQSGGTNYLTIPNPATPSQGYNAAHVPLSLSYGNGVTASFAYNLRLQVSSLAYSNPSGQIFGLTYGYGTANNGQIQSITDNVDSTRSMNYTYDAWARLKTATAGPTATPTWGLSWTYDRYGNRITQNVTAGTAWPNQVSVSPNTNRISDAGYGYDAAGNLTNDGLNTLVYDAENRLVTSTQAGSTSSYSYDGNNLRVQRVRSATTTVYVFSGTKVMAEYENGVAVASPTREYIYSGSQLLATIEGTVTKYHHSDHLSIRATTDSTGTVISQQGHAPFGESWYSTGTASPSKWGFTTYERDAESGNDYALARYHVNRLGRFSSPDPVAGSLTDPQSLNRYSYVGNRPTTLTDPNGLYPRDQHLYITFLLAVLAGRPDAAAIAKGAGEMDNFRNATTGLLGIGWAMNFDKHFGVPCNVMGPCPSGGIESGQKLHLVEDNSPGGPHQIVAGYGLGARVLSSIAHVGLSIIGKNPDRGTGAGSGFVGAWMVLSGDPYPEAAEYVRQTVNANGLTIVGMQVINGAGVSELGNVNFAGASLVATKIVGGIAVNTYQLPGRDNFYDDPNVRAIQGAFNLPGSSPMREAEALYLYGVYGMGGGGGTWLGIPPRDN